jgi:hypothetical protein
LRLEPQKVHKNRFPVGSSSKMALLDRVSMES